MIDSHAHLDSPRYAEDRDALLGRSYEAGVQAILSIGIGDGPETMHQALDIARQYAGVPNVPKIYASAGVHPQEVQLLDEAACAKLDSLLQEPEVIACGEIGLDYYHPENAPREVQMAGFSRQMEIAAAHKKPIIIHCRPSDGSTNAWDDTLAQLEAEWRPTGLGGILHCFTGEIHHAKQAIDFGFLVSFAGNSTYPKAQPIRDAMAALPLERMLIETDAPFLAPIPNRGKRNEPAWVAEVARTLGQVRGISPEEAAFRTTENFHRLFRTATDPEMPL
ncbi:TatD family hydrolase [Silvibacterium dinghuense]|uniref:TatD family deoxyribonuclease n=1 Tax=Silvibacterium dinghuense TaxID=1560006 RepID=A0A4V1NVR9_9BACT|nr:TatD family hydrolase [Silvibacterium dinghuense]RXS96882.1 TatD family deoxyribonuclease [Silvibacterium dinghuense]GGG94410.1 LuxR family transcriptional regulator [Silvibacterium dinghuense]